MQSRAAVRGAGGNVLPNPRDLRNPQKLCSLDAALPGWPAGRRRLRWTKRWGQKDAGIPPLGMSISAVSARRPTRPNQSAPQRNAGSGSATLDSAIPPGHLRQAYGGQARAIPAWLSFDVTPALRGELQARPGHLY